MRDFEAMMTQSMASVNEDLARSREELRHHMEELRSSTMAVPVQLGTCKNAILKSRYQERSTWRVLMKIF
ncbi:hypothetical protein L484_021744 [Morus notabilis]|uniref:Uncharacterized protein n=1 Tax=Morus notabilis TaxID=981085 RepID=W9RW91_9ROSA|nr:hypothetical protein L484_021744 [Morus notabilis]